MVLLVKYDLKVACKGCPFRAEHAGPSADGPVRLNEVRIVEIHNAITDWHGGEFPCHKTGDYGDRNSRKEKMCAGAIGYLANIDSDGAQTIKYAVYGMEKLDYTDYGPPEEMFESLGAFRATALDGRGGPIEPCNTVGPNCLAPAGYQTSGGVAHGTESADGECRECGEATCSACLQDGLCEYCAECGEDDED